MDLAFTPEEQAFREEVRAWVQSNLPKEISHKVHNALRLTRMPKPASLQPTLDPQPMPA